MKLLVFLGVALSLIYSSLTFADVIQVKDEDGVYRNIPLENLREAYLSSYVPSDGENYLRFLYADSDLYDRTTGELL